MAEKYFVDCSCGKKNRVELFQAGTEITCPACRSTVNIPNTNRLKELSGDKYPLLRPIEKIVHTAQHGESPFDGTCHGCEGSLSTMQIPITINMLVERQVDHDGGIRPFGVSGVQLVAAASNEKRQIVRFPLLLCDKCLAEFRASQARARSVYVAKQIGLGWLLVAFLLCIYYDAALVAALAGVLTLVGVIAWIMQFGDNKKIEPFVLKWLNKIRWFPEAIELEAEYTVTTNLPCRINRSPG